ncbi:MAG: helix-hairpin-helix domain-containing protein [Candidatus Omnitrophota bacterium]
MFYLTLKERKVLIFIGILILLGSLLRLRNLNPASRTALSSPESIIVNQGIISDELININQASVDLLIKIPGIGEAIAGRIIEHRLQFGSFMSLDDLKKVKGIGDNKIKIIKRHIVFD